MTTRRRSWDDAAETERDGSRAARASVVLVVLDPELARLLEVLVRLDGVPGGLVREPAPPVGEPVLRVDLDRARAGLDRPERLALLDEDAGPADVRHDVRRLERGSGVEVGRRGVEVAELGERLAATDERVHVL